MLFWSNLTNISMFPRFGCNNDTIIACELQLYLTVDTFNQLILWTVGSRFRVRRSQPLHICQCHWNSLLLDYQLRKDSTQQSVPQGSITGRTNLSPITTNCNLILLSGFTYSSTVECFDDKLMKDEMELSIELFRSVTCFIGDLLMGII